MGDNIMAILNTEADNEAEMWWSDDHGWTFRESASLYLPEHAPKVSLPSGGKWVETTDTVFVQDAEGTVRVDISFNLDVPFARARRLGPITPSDLEGTARSIVADCLRAEGIRTFITFEARICGQTFNVADY